ncbi:hypothetical protein J3R30DRAFT_3503247 [Lentinula aciculospora]|uniref:Uncharacterized protein n=1 Tax=Lentinula aciculospora TaxID=153920 RepID=A0A9W9A5E1_9AGAR|nr:hypothetical protein J3R30DRAFT_3503247 [Lentinula aciculospora]
MSFSDNQRVLLAKSASPLETFFPNENCSQRTFTNYNDEYEDYPPSITPLVAYPSPAHTNCNVGHNILLPSPASSLYSHEELNEEESDSKTMPPERILHHPGRASVVDRTGGVLDSPVICMHHSAPISPPPTLPTLTAVLPPNEEDQADVLNIFTPPSLLESCREYPNSCDIHPSLSALNTDQTDQSELALQKNHLLSPLSPKLVNSIAGVRSVRQSPHLPSSDFGAANSSGGSDELSEPFWPFDFGPLDLNSLLLDQEISPSSLGMFKEKRSWILHSMKSSLNHDDSTSHVSERTTTPKLCYYSDNSFHPSRHQTQDRIRVPRRPKHPFYPSPDMSPEQPIESAFPYPSSPLIQRYIELDGLENREGLGYPEHSELVDQPTGQSDRYDNNEHYDYGYEGDGAVGSQSPSIRTFSLPELETDGDSYIGPDSGLGLSLTSFPSSSEVAPAVEVDSSIFPSSRHTWSSSLSSSIPSSSTLRYPPSASSSTFSNPSSSSELKLDSFYQLLSPIQLSSTESDINSLYTSPSNLLLDVNHDSSPISQSNGAFYPNRLSSPNTLVESLDSRLSYLSSDSSSINIPPDIDCPEYTTLRAHAELHRDLLQLLVLRRQAQVAEKAAKRRERELDAQVGISGMIGQDVIELDSIKPPARSLAVVAQAEKLKARSTRKREKERCREIAAMVTLTLFGSGRGTDPDPKSMDDANEAASDSTEFSQGSRLTTSSISHCKKELKERKKKKKKVTLMSMAQLVARMILRRRDHSVSSQSSFSHPKSHQPLFSPPGVGPRRYVKSPLWQCMSIDYHEDDLGEGEILGVHVGLDVEGRSGRQQQEAQDEVEDEDDFGLGSLKGFGDFGETPEWPVMVGPL